MKNISIVFLLSGFVLAGCSRDRGPQQLVPRPVTYVTLKTMNPGKTSRLTGSVESWKREDIGFEVAGRVLRVVEPGANIVGRTYDEKGDLLTEGMVLAEIDNERYQIALAQAQAAADAAKAEILIKDKLSRGEGLAEEGEKSCSGLKRDVFRGCLANAGQLRLMPILMTTLTTVGGLLSLMLAGGPLFKGLATVIVFGLSIGTAFTLFFLPAIYAVFVENFGMKIKPDEVEA